ncbi:allophanate hydrolase-related protein [Pseudonocardia sp. HH130629-09]|uniref:allophanate hydrolase-related protein n=1 Tax=Pseudonocardia sp. HH130629-09 TaxID=1641402 RepID=UPI0006CB2B5F|nr:hypothetical protein [Pseudonocardia sp. HH130629-09]ALE81879.1 hypothetical protein XF36_01030 [Pseudonocardia sp. HH130629-09]
MLTGGFAVVAAHRRGQPLHHELLALGARFRAVRVTAPEYRLLALDGDVPRGGLLRVGAGGAAIEVEVFDLPAAAPAGLVLPAPLARGRVLLDDGDPVAGIVCTTATPGARDVTEHGSWPAYLAAR